MITSTRRRSVSILASLAPLLFACPAQRAPSAQPRRTPSAQRARQGAAAVSPPEAACPQKPNFLLIVVDTLRYDASGLDPTSGNATPFLERLRQRGINFTQCYSTADSTPPSHFSLLTGYVNGWQGPLDTKQASLAYQLRRIGYHTFGVAANGNLSQKANRYVMAFQDYACLQDVYESLSEAEKTRAWKRVDARIRAYDSEPNDWYRLFVWSSAHQVLPRFRRDLDRSGSPFFGFVNLIDAHDPYFPDPRFYRRSHEKARPPGLRYRALSPELQHPDQIADEQRRAFVQAKIAQAGGRPWSTTLDLTPAEIGVYHQRYLAEVRELDKAIEELFAALVKRGLMDNTVIFLTSDHGESFGEEQLITHSFDNKGDREATNRVPLLILLPACYRAKPATVTTVTTIADLAPTIYELAHVAWQGLAVRALPGMYGKSLLPYWTTEQRMPVASIRLDERTPQSAAETKKQDDEARKRLRSLGYLQ